MNWNWEPTYRMAENAPTSITWNEFFSHVSSRWEKLLASKDCSEKKVQKFLEQHPYLLPAPIGVFRHGNDNVMSRAVVTQPELPGLKCKVPDFMYFTGNSGEITVVLIEIESPNKKWFTQTGQQTAALTQAANQLAEWKAWFSIPEKVLEFEREYKVRDYGMLSDRQFKQHYVLVIGRRDHITSPATRRQRSFLQRENETWMTYDRLEVRHDFDEAITVKLDRSGLDTHFRAVHVTPMMKLGPYQYGNYHEIEGLQTAINSNKLMSKERKKFLVKRLPYWKQWLTSLNGGYSMRSSDMQGE